MQQLECTLRRARIAIAEPKIGIDNADKVELGEMVPLRHQLRADDDVELAVGDIIQLLTQALHRFDDVARQNENALVGKQVGRLLLQPFDAGADRGEALGGVAVRAIIRRRHVVAAVMADQALAEAMIDQPGVAVRALQAETAGAA